MSYTPGIVPKINDANDLRAYVEDELKKLAQALNEQIAVDLRPVFRAPDRPREGMIVYADGSDWNPGSGEGPYVYKDGGWVALIAARASKGFSAHKNGVDQTGIVSDTFTKITFGTELYDTGASYAASTWTPRAGLIVGTAAVEPINLNGSGFPEIALYKNGTRYKSFFFDNTAYPAGDLQLPIVFSDNANGTDTYDIWAKGVAAATLTISGAVLYTWFQGVELG